MEAAAGTTITDAGSEAAVDKKKDKMVAHQLLLPVSMAEKRMVVRIYLPYPLVQLVSGYALLMALVSPFSSALGSALVYALISSQSAFLNRFPELTETQDAQLSDLLDGRMLCATVQAAAAALALALPCHHGSRIRRAFGYVAIVASVVNHWMHATALLVVIPAFPAPADDLLFRIIPGTAVVLCLMPDLLGLLALLFLGGGDEQD